MAFKKDWINFWKRISTATSHNGLWMPVVGDHRRGEGCCTEVLLVGFSKDIWVATVSRGCWSRWVFGKRVQVPCR